MHAREILEHEDFQAAVERVRQRLFTSIERSNHAQAKERHEAWHRLQALKSVMDDLRKEVDREKRQASAEADIARLRHRAIS